LITIRLFAALRDAVGGRTAVLPLMECTTVRHAIETLTSRHAKLVSLLYKDQEADELNDFYHILVNGKAIERQGGLDMELRDGDVISILPPVGGGA